MMEISIIKFTERDDGSADVEIRMDDRTKLFLFNYAFNEILRKNLDKVEQLHSEGLHVEFDR
jgi:hypothetical protein